MSTYKTTSSPEVNDRRLAKENAARRISEKEKDQTIAAQNKRIAELEAKLGGAASGDSAAGPPSGEGNAAPASGTADDAIPNAPDPGLPAPVADLSSGNDDELMQEQHKASELERRIIAAEMERAGVRLPTDAADLLIARKAVQVNEEGEPVVLVDGKPSPMTEQALERILDLTWFRAKGVSGTGSRGSISRSGEVYDHDRAMRDPSYFSRHEKEAREELRRRLMK